ncbi:MAG: TolC family protein [Bacteroidales bacterium]|nr:TolC family protein [Bacteroidales bacterium]
MKKILLTFFVVMLHAFSLFSQEIWSLSDCIKYAFDNNIQIQQQKLNSVMANHDLWQSRAALLPSINASASHAYNFGKTIDMYTNDFATARVQSNNFYISSSMTIFNGFQLLNTVKQKMIEQEAAAYDIEKIQNDIALAIATAYLQVLFSYEYLEIKTNQLEISKQQVRQTQMLVDAGTLPMASLYSIEAQSASEELQYVNAENQLNMAYLSLAQLLDLPSVQGITISRPEIDITTMTVPAYTPEFIYNTALQIQPEILSAELKLNSAQRGLSIARAYTLPNLSLRGSYGTGYSGASREVKDFIITGQTPIGVTQSLEVVYGPVFEYITEVQPFKDQISDNLNSSIGLYLSIPIFNNLQARTAINKSRILIENSRLNLQSVKNQLNKNIQQASADAVSAFNRYLASEKAVKSFEESFNYMQERFNLGMLNTIDYNDAKTKLDNAKGELLQAKYEYIFRVKILDFYMGKPISL